MKHFHFPGLRVLLVAFFLCAVVGAAPETGYHLVKKYPLGSEGGWDYLTLDSATRRLYIARATRVMVVDADSGKVVGEIPDTPGVHGVALAPELGRGFTSNGREGTVSIFELKDLKVVGRIKVGENPDAILYDSASRRVFVFNGRSRDASVMDAAAGTVVGTIPLDGKPEFGVSDGLGKVFVNLEDTSQVAALDAGKLSLLARWPLAPCQEPTGLAVDRKNHRLFVGCSNKLMAILDADTGRILTTLPVGGGVDATAFDPDTGLAFSSNGEGTLTVVHEDSPNAFRVVENAATQRYARTMALDPKTHDVFLVTAEFAPPPAAAPGQPRPRPAVLPDSFVVLVMGKSSQAARFASAGRPGGKSP